MKKIYNKKVDFVVIFTILAIIGIIFMRDKLFGSNVKIYGFDIAEPIMAKYERSEKYFTPIDETATIYLHGFNGRINCVEFLFDEQLKENTTFYIFNSSEGVNQYLLKKYSIDKKNKKICINFNDTKVDQIKILAKSFDDKNFVDIPVGKINILEKRFSINNCRKNINLLLEVLIINLFISVLVMCLYDKGKNCFLRYSQYLSDTDNHVNPLNVIRVMAALMVFMLHATLFENKVSLLYNNGESFLWHPSAWSGVWIFFIVGGYLAGKGFVSGRYGYDVKSIKKYYWNKIKKVIFPTVIFIAFCGIFVYPDFFYKNIGVILANFFTFKYIGQPGVDGIGATWYVSTLIFFYLITPFVACLFNYIEKNNYKIMYFIFIIILTSGLMYRIYCLETNLEWNKYVYCPFYANIDLFIGGMLLSYIFYNLNKKIEKSTNIKVISCVILVCTVLLNSYLYLQADMGSSICDKWVKYYFQTILIIVCSIFIFAFDTNESKVNTISIEKIKNNPLRIIDAFAKISFEFYLFHSLILHLISPYLSITNNISNISWLCFLIVMMIITCVCSIGYHRIFEKKVN